MEGAIEAGERAAAEISTALREESRAPDGGGVRSAR
jgi:hypothetical protein